MFSIRLTALSCAAAFIAGTASTLAVWNYIERGRTIEDQKLRMSSKDKVIELVTDRSKTEEKITNDKDARIKKLDEKFRTQHDLMSPAVRAAIDSLHK